MGFGPQTFTLGVNDTLTISNYQLSLSQPIYTGGKLFSGLRSSQKGFSVAQEQLKSAMQNVSYNVTVAYFGVIQAEKFQELAQQSFDIAQEHLNQVNAMLKAGTSTRADVLRAEVSKAQAEVSLTKAKNSVLIAKNNFNNSLGKDLFEEIPLSETEFTIKYEQIPEYSILLGYAYENRPDWKQFLFGKEIAAESVNIARSDYFPSLALVGTYGEQMSVYPSFTSDSHSWTAIVSGSWSLLEAPRRGKLKEARARLEEQNEQERSLYNTIALEVRNTFFDLKSALETLASTQKAVELAQENLKVSEVRFTSGLGTNLEVMDAQVALTQASIDNLDAIFGIITSKAKINRVTGLEIFDLKGGKDL
ncbi:MAG: TolC family protein [Candidatus Margulisbacteria bacterium]|nr:TolC family protein [Candidatus Margulisiibacteriota bacterium]